MKKKIFAIVIMSGILCLLFARSVFLSSDKSKQTKGEAGGRITRATAAKMVSSLHYKQKEIEQLDWQIVYTDIRKEQWYGKYINALYAMGIREKDGNEKDFEPQSYLTCTDADNMLRQWAILRGKENNEDASRLYEEVKKEAHTDFQGEEYITLDQWNGLYEVINEKWYSHPVEKKEFYIIKLSEEEDSWKAYTDNGELSFTGIAVDTMVDSVVTAYVRGKEVLQVLKLSRDSYTLENVCVTGCAGNELTLNFPSCQKTYKCTDEGNLSFISKTDFEVFYADLQMENGKVTEIEVRKNIENSEYVPSRTIRVLLTTDDFSSKFHEKIQIKCDKEIVQSGGEEGKEIKGGKKLTIKNGDERLKNGEIILQGTKDSKLTILSLSRNNIHPQYRGKLIIRQMDEGLVLVNELSIEEYLYAVLPSEMPSNYDKEALKAQAVCARTYAYGKLEDETYKDYGADLDDSTSYQVYNNIAETKESISAVNETAGEILTCNDQVISTYYFSTSCGHTSTAKQVWSGAKNQDYLVGKYLVEKGSDMSLLKNMDLQQDKDFREFLKNKAETFDSDAAWYRWKTTLSAEQIQTNVDMYLEERYKANPELVLTRDDEGQYRSIQVGTVGEVYNIIPVKRADGGLVTELVIEGSENTVKLYTEYNIRKILAPYHNKIVRKDKSSVQGLSMLPSGYFVVDKVQKKGKTSFVFQGGGYGHGVGMSQTGACAMADKGYSYEEILTYFYQGSQITTPEKL